MKVGVRLFASLRVGRPELAELELPAGSSVAAALRAAGLEAGEASIVFRNSRPAQPADPLEEGDLLAAFPPIGGG